MSMSYSSNFAIPSQAEINSAFVSAMGRVYFWMTGGLVLTTAVAVVVANNPNVQEALFGNSFIWIVLLGAQIGLVLLISAAINKLAPPVALGLFFLYSALTGTTLSVIFLVYDLGSIGLAFGSAASIFAGLSIFGLTTKKDLTQWGAHPHGGALRFDRGVGGKLVFSKHGVGVVGVVYRRDHFHGPNRLRFQEDQGDDLRGSGERRHHGRKPHRRHGRPAPLS